MKHLTEEQLILHHYGEGDEPQMVSAHVESCELCRTHYQRLCQTLLLVESTPIPERDQNYGAQVWRQVRPRLAARPGPAPAHWSISTFFANLGAFRFYRLSFVGGFALLVLAAFLAGRFWSPLKSSTSALFGKTSAPVSVGAHERVLLNEIGDHLEQSQLALIELINSKTNGVVDISLEREMAQQLIGVNRLYRQAAARLGDTGTVAVLEDLERALVEITKSPAHLSPGEFAEFRSRLDADGLLSKVKVFGSQVRAKEREAARDLAGNRS
jgi:hypothetical protein